LSPHHMVFAGLLVGRGDGSVVTVVARAP
jgi:hypothetical protein